MQKQVLSAALAATVILGAGSLQHACAVVDSARPTHVVGIGLDCTAVGAGYGFQGPTKEHSGDPADYTEEFCRAFVEPHLKNTEGVLVLSEDKVSALKDEVSLGVEKVQKSKVLQYVKVVVNGDGTSTVALLPFQPGVSAGTAMGFPDADQPELDLARASLVLGVSISTPDGKSQNIVKANLTADELTKFVGEVDGLTAEQRKEILKSLLMFAGSIQQSGKPASVKVEVRNDASDWGARQVKHEDGADVETELAASF